VNVRYYIDPETGVPHIYGHVVESTSAKTTEEAMTEGNYPAGWDAERVRRVLDHYVAQSDDEAVAEDVPAVRALIAKHTAR
jgi:hypothetical protein